MDSIWYYKYLKYKKKYVEKKLDTHLNDESNNLYLKFITEKLVAYNNDDFNIGSYVSDETSHITGYKSRMLGGSNIFTTPNNKRYLDDAEDNTSDSKKQYRRSLRIRKLSQRLLDYELNLTQAIIRYVSPRSKPYIQQDMEIDNKVIKYIEDMKEYNKAYSNYENYGKLIECWLSDNMRCPCCNQKTLRRYYKDNMPVIDLMCINREHTIAKGVKYFQVKASNGALFNGKQYFNYDPENKFEYSNTIHVGSFNYGQHVHKIQPNSDLFDKKILCGYICIYYRESKKEIAILDTSFCVLPIYRGKENIVQNLFGITKEKDYIVTEENNWYYKYINNNKKHYRIKFNLNTNRLVMINQGLLEHNFSKEYIIKTDPLENPYNIFEYT